LKVDSSYKSAKKNLKFILTLTKDKQSEENKDLFNSIMEKVFNLFSLNLLALISLLIFLGIIIYLNFIIIGYRNREKTVPIFITSILLFLLFLFLVLSFLKWKQFHSNKEAVLISSTAIGYSGPSEDFTRVFTIHEGMLFTVEKDIKGWSLVKLSNGIGGWIQTDSYERIKFLSNK